MKPDNMRIVNFMLRTNLITNEQYKSLMNGEMLETPVLSKEAFEIYKSSSLNALLKKIPKKLKNKYETATETLWKLDEEDVAELISSTSTSDLDETIITTLINYGAERLEYKIRILNEQTRTLKEQINKVRIANTKAENYLQKELSKQKEEQVKRQYYNTKQELKSLTNKLRKLNNKIEQLTFSRDAIESYCTQMEKINDLSVYILSSGKNPFSWERIGAGEYTYGSNALIKRDYQTSHNELSVINNFINHPASFYLFTEFKGVERGYARGHIDFDENNVFLKVEALHAKGIGSERQRDDEGIAELSLISGLIYLTRELGLNEIRWGKVGVSNFYNLMEKKGKIKYLPVTF